MTKLNIENLLHETDAAVILNVSVDCLQRWRCYGGGPPFFRAGGKKGGAVRYRKSDLIRYIEENTVSSQSDIQR